MGCISWSVVIKSESLQINIYAEKYTSAHIDCWELLCDFLLERFLQLAVLSFFFFFLLSICMHRASFFFIVIAVKLQNKRLSSVSLYLDKSYPKCSGLLRQEIE